MKIITNNVQNQINIDQTQLDIIDDGHRDIEVSENSNDLL